MAARCRCCRFVDAAAPLSPPARKGTTNHVYPTLRSQRIHAPAPAQPQRLRRSHARPLLPGARPAPSLGLHAGPPRGPRQGARDRLGEREGASRRDGAAVRGAGRQAQRDASRGAAAPQGLSPAPQAFAGGPGQALAGVLWENALSSSESARARKAIWL